MLYEGNAHKFGDNINTDDIIAGKYKHKSIDPDILVKHIMENIRPDFFYKISVGDFIVAGENFGCGSSREQAPQIIKHAGITAVVAKSFARIFYRNAINIGLLLITADTDLITEGENMIYDSEKKQVLLPKSDRIINTPEVPKEIFGIMNSGGLLNYVKEKGSL